MSASGVRSSELNSLFACCPKCGKPPPTGQSMFLCACAAEEKAGTTDGCGGRLRAAMRLHDDSLLRALGCNAADLLTLAEAEAAAAAVRVMSARPDSSDVAIFGCAALTMLAQRGDRGAKAVREAGGVPAVVHALGAFAELGQVQEYGCTLLVHIADDAAGKRAVLAAGGVGALVRAVLEQPLDTQERTSAPQTTL